MTNYPKISMLKIYLDVLDPEQKKIFEKLRAFGKDGVLGGETAISLQIKHRRSFDFDIFLPKPIPQTLFKKTQEVFGPNLEKLIDSTDQLTFLILLMEKLPLPFCIVIFHLFTLWSKQKLLTSLIFGI